jgi:hypothetical protein
VRARQTHEDEGDGDDEGERVSPHGLVVGPVALREELQVWVQLILAQRLWNTSSFAY